MLATCPFCPLRCDDFPVVSHIDDNDSRRVPVLHVPEGYCDRATASLKALNKQLASCVGSVNLTFASESLAAKMMQLEDAAGQAEWGLGGLCLDLQTARWGVRLAAGLGGRLEFAASPSAVAFRLAGERSGWTAATLGELTQRIDSIVLVGDVLGHYPRLLKRWIIDGAREEITARRRYCHLISSDQRANVSVLEGATVIEYQPAMLHERLAAVRLADRQKNCQDPLQQWLQQGDSTAWLWSGDVFDVTAASTLCELINEMNQQRRCVAIPLADDALARNVTSWLSGVAGPVDFRCLPVTRQSWESPAVPLRLWLQPYPTAPPPPVDDAYLVVVGLADEETRARADLYVRTRVPGIEQAGTTLRGDGTVSLPLSQICAAGELPTTAAVLEHWASDIPLRRMQRC